MPSSNDPKLLEPLVLSGPAVERDERVRDKNNAPCADEGEWIQNLKIQNDSISKAEAGFFAELHRRIVE
jgi:hypothetical protein